MVSPRVIVFSALLAFATATSVEQCPGQNIEDLSDKVQLTPCTKIPCRLKQGTSTHIQVNFAPSVDVADVKNHVKAEVFGVPLPFVGVDGNSICTKITTEDGEKASCPLKAGTKYIYKDSFPVLDFYPKISVKVHWALQDGDKDIICFEVPARIVGKATKA